MTIDDMRTLLGLGSDVPDAEVVAAYAAYLAGGDPGDIEEPLSLAELKFDLGLDPTATDQDVRLARLVSAARRAIERRINHSIVGVAPSLPAADRDLARQAISLVVATWFALPEGVSVDGRAGDVELPLGVSWIVDAIKRWPDE